MDSVKGNFLFLVDNLYEDLELWYPKLRLLEAGGEVFVAGPDPAGTLYKGKNGYPCISDISISNVDDKNFTGLILPGGFAPDKLRRIELVKEITRSFMNSGRLVAHICHAGWIPVSAGICRGFRMTSTPGIKDDLINAGATWIDEPVVVDRNMVSSRRPDDLPWFMKGIFEFLAKAL